MKIIAVDPGYDRVGIAILEKDLTPSHRGVEQLIHSETFTTDKNMDINDRLFAVGKRIEELCREYSTEYLAIEKLFFTNNQKTAMAVSQARGITMYAAHECGAQVKEFTPLQIKVAVTGNGRADKKSVINMTKRLIKIPEDSHVMGAQSKRLDDEYDAIACGLCFFAHFRLEGGI